MTLPHNVPVASNLKFIVGGFLLIAVVIALIVQATMSTGAYYLTVNEVRSGAANLVGQRIRVNGAVVPGSEDLECAGDYVALCHQ